LVVFTVISLILMPKDHILSENFLQRSNLHRFLSWLFTVIFDFMRKWYQEVLKDIKYSVCLSQSLREASRRPI